MLGTVVTLVLSLLLCLNLAADTRRYAGTTVTPPAGIVQTGQGSAFSGADTTSLTIANLNTGCSGGENCALVIFAMQRGSVSGEICTYGGITVTGPGVNDGQGNAQLYGVVGVGQTGTGDVVCSWTTARPACVLAIAFSGVQQTNPIGSPENDDVTKGNTLTNPQVTLPSAVGELQLDALNRTHNAEAVTLGAGQTQVFNFDVTDRLTCVASTKPGAAPNQTTQLSWPTGEQSIYYALSLVPAP